MPRSTMPLWVLIACFLASCTEHETPSELYFEELPSPAAPGSGMPEFAVTPSGTVYLSWLEPGREKAHAFRLARLGDTGVATKTIAEGDSWFVNWADFPTIMAWSDTALAAHFLTLNGASAYAYDVRVTQSRDGGSSWTTPIKPHRDNTQNEHGFVSLVPWKDDAVLVAWLDGRTYPDLQEMTLRSAVLDATGAITNETLLDARVCDCCQTSAAKTATGTVLAYRDRSEDEIRDIAVIRIDDSGPSEPTIVATDGWRITGCPVNGPAVSAQGQQVAVAWYTEAGDQPRVHVALSSNEARTFGPALRADDGNAIGRVDVAVDLEGYTHVSWVERTEDGAVIRLRRFDQAGSPMDVTTVVATSAERASGFPRLAVGSGEVYVAWTDAHASPSQVRITRAR